MNPFYRHCWIFALSAALLLGCQPSNEQTETAQASAAPQQSYDPEAKLKAMGIELQEPAPPTANFVRAVRTGNLVFLAGHGPGRNEGGDPIQGRLGEDMTIEQGQDAAKRSGIQLLASLKQEIGNLNKVKRVVKVLGMVNSTPDFTDQPKVMNGFSDFIVEVFGERGKHARAAVGMAALPNHIPVEIEMVVEIEL